ncbi:hypothetical protein HQ571_02945 [Candidatus Kuenenbacteria bacterium]|nr:hypothetical protein [Candidatus Kuenenbacteria bacterium]
MEGVIAIIVIGVIVVAVSIFAIRFKRSLNSMMYDSRVVIENAFAAAKDKLNEKTFVIAIHTTKSARTDIENIVIQELKKLGAKILLLTNAEWKTLRSGDLAILKNDKAELAIIGCVRQNFYDKDFFSFHKNEAEKPVLDFKVVNKDGEIIHLDVVESFFEQLTARAAAASIANAL